MKELSAAISTAIEALKAAGEVRDFSVTFNLPAIDGYTPSVFVNVIKPSVGAALSTEIEVTKDMVELAKPEKKSRKSKEDATVIDMALFENQPDEVLAALLALYPAKEDYTVEEIKAAVELLASGNHGNAESLADEILQILKDNGEPRLLNKTAAKLMGQVLEWWDDLEDKSAYFAQLKAAKPAEREEIVPAIYWQDEEGAFGKFEGKGQLEQFRELRTSAEIAADIAVKQITAKEFAKLEKSPKVDFEALRAEGLALVRKKCNSNRDTLEAILREHGAVNPETDKASWTFINDENVVAAVDALKAL